MYRNKEIVYSNFKCLETSSVSICNTCWEEWEEHSADSHQSLPRPNSPQKEGTTRFAQKGEQESEVVTQHKFKYHLVIQNNCLHWMSLKLWGKRQLNKLLTREKISSWRKMLQEEYRNLLLALSCRDSQCADMAAGQGALPIPISSPHSHHSCEPCTLRAHGTSCLSTGTALLLPASTTGLQSKHQSSDVWWSPWGMWHHQPYTWPQVTKSIRHMWKK